MRGPFLPESRKNIYTTFLPFLVSSHDSHEPARIYKTCERFRVRPSVAFQMVASSHAAYQHASKQKGRWNVATGGTLSMDFNVDGLGADRRWRKRAVFEKAPQSVGGFVLGVVERQSKRKSTVSGGFPVMLVSNQGYAGG